VTESAGLTPSPGRFTVKVVPSPHISSGSAGGDCAQAVEGCHAQPATTAVSARASGSHDEALERCMCEFLLVCATREVRCDALESVRNLGKSTARVNGGRPLPALNRYPLTVLELAGRLHVPIDLLAGLK
jgi:hypothetical protein